MVAHYASPHSQGGGTNTMAALANYFFQGGLLCMAWYASNGVVTSCRPQWCEHRCCHAGNQPQAGARGSHQAIPDGYCRLWGHCSFANCGVALSGAMLWWHAQFRANPMTPNVCLDVTAIAVLHTTPLPLFLGHPSLQDLVDRVDTLAMAVIQQHREMLKACTHMCNAPISRRTICATLDIARDAGRQHMYHQCLA